MVLCNTHLLNCRIHHTLPRNTRDDRHVPRMDIDTPTESEPPSPILTRLVITVEVAERRFGQFGYG